MRLLSCLTFFIFSFALSKGQSNDLGDICNRCLRNLLANKLGLPVNYFKLSQGSQVVGANSDWLWNTFDAIVPYNTGYYYDPAKTNLLSSDYGLILSQLDKGTEYKCDLAASIIKYGDAKPSFVWDKTLEDLLAKLNSAPSLKVCTDTTIRDTLFSKDLNKAYLIHFKITASFQHCLIFSAMPYQQNIKDPVLQKYKPWYTACVLKTAYQDKGFRLWETAFGDKGFMEYVCKSLIFVEGEDITIEANSFLTSFVDATGNGVPCAFRYNDYCYQAVDSSYSSYSSKTTSLPKNPLLLGVLIENIADYINLP